MTDRLKALADAGVSIWLDDLSRERIETGNLAELSGDALVVGVTTNPSIFAAALSDGERYDAQVRELAAARGADVDATVFALTTTDVREACDILRPAFDARTAPTVASRSRSPRRWRSTPPRTDPAWPRTLWAEVDRDNLPDQDPRHHRGRARDHRRPRPRGSASTSR